MARSRTALCVIRVWTEEGSTVLRAEVSLTSDVSGGPRRTVIVAGDLEVERVVRSWLSGVTAGGDADSVANLSK